MYETSTEAVRYSRPDQLAYREAVPLGGLGTGSVMLCQDGSFRSWQVFNNWGNSETLGLGKHYPSCDLENAALMFAARTPGGEWVTRELETNPLHGLPGLPAIDYRGQFPFARWPRGSFYQCVFGERRR